MEGKRVFERQRVGRVRESVWESDEGRESEGQRETESERESGGGRGRTQLQLTLHFQVRTEAERVKQSKQKTATLKEDIGLVTDSCSSTKQMKSFQLFLPSRRHHNKKQACQVCCRAHLSLKCRRNSSDLIKPAIWKPPDGISSRQYCQCLHRWRGFIHSQKLVANSCALPHQLQWTRERSERPWNWWRDGSTAEPTALTSGEKRMWTVSTG